MTAGGPVDITAAPAELDLSVVLPARDEAQNVAPLCAELHAVMASLELSYELIFVDDGSRDGTDTQLRALCDADARVRLIRLRRSFGKAAALMTGFRAARGRLVVTMDADGQDDPAELPRLLEALDADGGADLVTGRKSERQDPASKVWPSRLFNGTISLLTGVPVKDVNSGYKLYRREVVDELSLYGELHRFVPVLAHARGFRVCEVPVAHRPRRFGESKYGVERLARGLFDLLTVLFLTRYAIRPLHLFGIIGLACLGLGGAISAYFMLQWLSGMPMHVRPIMIFGWISIVLGVQFVSIGLLAEMILSLASRPRDEAAVAERYTKN